MNKYLKYALIAAAAIILLVIGLVGYIAATFDPNAYKPQIIQLVKEKKQRNLKLEGDIKLAFFPSLGVDLGKLSLSEHGSEQEFAEVGSARASLALMPLLRKQLVVSEIAVSGLKATLIRYKDGRTNIDDLMSPPEEKSERLQFDIDHVRVENAALTVRDEASGGQYALADLNLKTGRIANAVPSNVELAFNTRISRPGEPVISLANHLKTKLTFDLDKKHYSLADLALESKGEAAGISDLVVKAGGDISLRPADSEFDANKFSLSLAGVSGKDKLDVKLDMPRLSFSRDKATGDKVTLVAKIVGPEGSTDGNLSLSGVEGSEKAFKSDAMILELDIKRGELAVKTRLASPLTGNLQSRQLNLPNLTAAINAAGPDIPGKSISGDLRGSAAVDGEKQNVQVNLAGKVADSNLKAKLGVNGFTKSAFNFDVEIDHLDVDSFLPHAKHEAPAHAAKESGADKPLDFSALKNLNANGSIRIGSLKAANVKSTNVRLDIKANNGKLDVNPLSANLYGGATNGSLSLNAAGPAVTARQHFAGVSIGPLLKDLANYDTLEGKGSVNLDVSSHGASVHAMKKGLNGTAALNLVDGAVKGINIAESIRNAKAKLGALRGEQVQSVNKAEKTDFSELKASFTIRNGIAHNQDLAMKSPLLRVTGEGDINLGEDSLNYLAKTTLVGTLAGQGGKELVDLRGVTIPVRVSGPFTAVQYKLDFSAMASEAVKQKVEQKKEELKGTLGEKLKGLFH